MAAAGRGYMQTCRVESGMMGVFLRREAVNGVVMACVVACHCIGIAISHSADFAPLKVNA